MHPGYSNALYVTLRCVHLGPSGYARLLRDVIMQDNEEGNGALFPFPLAPLFFHAHSSHQNFKFLRAKTIFYF